MSGSRVEKFRHHTRDVLEISTSELVILAEMLLRGPQTTGELRGRASRMHPLESIELVENLLQHLMDRPDPLLRRLAPAPGSRAVRFGQLLCPDLHPVTPVAEAHGPPTAPATDPDLCARIERLETELADLHRTVRQMAAVLSATSGSDVVEDRQVT